MLKEAHVFKAIMYPIRFQVKEITGNTW